MAEPTKTIQDILDMCTDPTFEFWFWSHAAFSKDRLACWEWQGSKNRKGYGVIRIPGNRRLVSAHRLAYVLANGEPQKDMICHRCDNPACINPLHLYDGTASENLRDANERNRRSKKRVLVPGKLQPGYKPPPR